MNFFTDRLDDPPCLKEVLEGALCLIEKQTVLKDGLLTFLKQYGNKITLFHFLKKYYGIISSRKDKWI